MKLPGEGSSGPLDERGSAVGQGSAADCTLDERGDETRLILLNEINQYIITELHVAEMETGNGNHMLLQSKGKGHVSIQEALFFQI